MGLVKVQSTDRGLTLTEEGRDYCKALRDGEK
jgi:hypothetical protein